MFGSGVINCKKLYLNTVMIKYKLKDIKNGLGCMKLTVNLMYFPSRHPGPAEDQPAVPHTTRLPAAQLQPLQARVHV